MDTNTRSRPGPKHEDTRRLPLVRSQALLTDARAEGKHSLIADWDRVLEQGMRRGRFWAESTYSRRDPNRGLYKKPTEDEIAEILEWLAKWPAVVMYGPKSEPRSRQELLSELDVSFLARHVELFSCFPAAMFEEAIWPRLVRGIANKWNAFRSPADRSVMLTQLGSPEAVGGPDRLEDPRGCADGLRRHCGV